MDTLALPVKTRNSDRKIKVLRREGLIPAEYYGRGVKNLSLQMDYQTFRKLYRVAGKSMVIELDVDGKKLNALVNDIQYDPVTDNINHVDFINVQMDQLLHTKIPLKFVGFSLAVKDLGGILTHNLSEIEVKCLPKDLVAFIEVSVDPIVDFRSYVRVKDLNVPSTITILNKPDDVVVTAVPPRVEEEETTTAAAATPDAAAVPGAAAATPEAGKEAEAKAAVPAEKKK